MKFWKPTNYKAGHFAEKIALLWLMCKGYWPIETNFMVGRGTGAGEVDLIVRRGKTLVFVEVKKRPTEEKARLAIRSKNQTRIQRSSEVFLMRHPQYRHFNIRYDAVFISPKHFPKHLKNAWRPFCLLLFVLCLSSCQIWTTLASGVHSAGTVIMDDRPIDEDASDISLYLAVRKNLSATQSKFLLDVQVTVFQGQVLLTGALPEISLIDQAVETTWRTPGVRHVYNYIRLGKAEGFIDTSNEAAISTAVRGQLMLTKGIKASNYKIVVESGVVYVMGLESSPEEWEAAKEVIKGTIGVQKIIYLMHTKNN
ncbi:MAG: YraN family protein [Alphaproteobacteria bacterium]|nr:YraN family protein [Alphaproteobacteria bacterium]